MKSVQILFLFLISLISVTAQSHKSFQNKPQILSKTAPTIEWSKCFGGNSYDWATSIDNTKDGGYIICGGTWSNNYDIIGNHGEIDYWILKLNANGKKEWQKCLGGSSGEEPSAIIQTSDGGYIVAGNSSSNNGDVIGNHGGGDAWIVKIDSLGTIEWQKCLGGKRNDEAHSIQNTSDGGYIVAGVTNSVDGDVLGKHSELDGKYKDYPYFSDSWIIKLDKFGTLEWQKCLGGSLNDGVVSIQQTIDGGYIVAGRTTSNDGDVVGFHCNSNFDIYNPDYWIVKLDSLGSIMWQKCLGGTRYDIASSIINSSDGGYVVTGISESEDGDLTGIHSKSSYPDYWTIKLDNSGEIEWKICNGAGYNDGGKSIIQTNDGYVIVGYASSFFGGENASHGFEDFGVVKLSLDGKTLWQKMFGSSGSDWPEAIIQSQDGGYVAVGYTPEKDGDITEFHGMRDFWILKLSPEGDNGIPDFQSNQIGMNISPNPSTDCINVEVQNFEPPQEIEIYNIFGERVMTIETQCIASLQKIDVSALLPGVYFVKVGNEKPMKFMVVR